MNRGGDWISGEIDTVKVAPLDLVDIMHEDERGMIRTVGYGTPAKHAFAATYTHWRRHAPSRPQPGQDRYIQWLVGELCLVGTGVVVADGIALEAANLLRAYEEVTVDHMRLVRELDVALCGETGAAKQATLGDLVHMVKNKRYRTLTEAQIRYFVDELAANVSDGSIALALAKAVAFA